jgi:hypothetical protein
MVKNMHFAAMAAALPFRFNMAAERSLKLLGC